MSPFEGFVFTSAALIAGLLGVVLGLLIATFKRNR